MPGVYCAGWIKRGPSGVIGTNKKDATETVALLLEDARRPAACAGGARPAAPLEALLAERGVEVVAYAGWEAIDAAERGARRAARPAAREARARWDELLAAARRANVAAGAPSVSPRRKLRAWR